jgi:hypothetical protein
MRPPPLCLVRAAGLLVMLACAPMAAAQNASDDPQPPPDPTFAASTKLVTLIGRDYPLGRASEALAAPSIAAPTIGRLPEGTIVRVVGITEGNYWYQIELPDKRLAYVETTAIPAAGEAPPGRTAAPPPISAAPASPAPLPAPSAAERPVAAAPKPPATPPPAAADDGPVLDLPPITEFAATHEVLGVVRPTAVYLAPDLRAPKAYPVAAGTEVNVVARSADGAWAWVATADGAAAYIPLADLAPPQ